jgi:signal transduction histidine kinase
MEGLRADASHAANELGEGSALAQSLARRAAAAAEVSLDLAQVADCPSDEASETIRLNDLVEDALADASARAARQGVTLDLKAAPELRLKTRPKTLLLLLRALLQHAISATPRGGQVLLCAYTVETGVLVSVQDGGPAVPEAARADVLENRVDPSALGRPTGMALSIAAAAAESLGSSVELRDGPEGQFEAWVMLGK